MTVQYQTIFDITATGYRTCRFAAFWLDLRHHRNLFGCVGDSAQESSLPRMVGSTTGQQGFCLLLLRVCPAMGLRVRVTYVGNSILKLEIAKP